MDEALYDLAQRRSAAVDACGDNSLAPTHGDPRARKQSLHAVDRDGGAGRAPWLLHDGVDLVTVVDGRGQNRYVSATAQGLLGRHPEELVGRGVESLVHPDDAPLLMEAIDRCSRGAETVGSISLRFRHKDGSWRDFETVGANLLREPAVHGIVLRSRSLSGGAEQHRAPGDIDFRFRGAFDHAPIGLAIVSPDGSLHEVNRSLCEMVGYTEQALLRLALHDITHRDDVGDHLELASRLWNEELESYRLELRLHHRRGSVIWVQCTGSTVREDDGARYSVVHIEDISDRRHLDMERATMLASEREYTRQLKHLAAMRSDFSAMVAHELRGPIATMRMMATVLATGELGAERQAATLAELSRQVDQLDRLVTDVATAGAAERDEFSVFPDVAPLALVVDAAAARARAILDESAVTISPCPDVRVWCDAERISQVLSNLIDNIAKHTPPGTPVELNVVLTENRVRIEVTDKGPGIAEGDLAVIFEKFGRGRDAALRKLSGTGLGLYLSRRIVQAHGEELSVASWPGEGTSFSFGLKVVR